MFSIQADDDLYVGLRTSLLLILACLHQHNNNSNSAYSSLFFLFSFSQYFEQCNFLSKISQQPFKLECLYLVFRLIMTYYIQGL